jgi:DNA-binding NarL/FixJ family response regulator
MELAGRWKAAGLDNREVAVRLCLQAGLTPQQVGDVIKRDRSTVRRINQKAEKKLQTGP